MSMPRPMPSRTTLTRSKNDCCSTFPSMERLSTQEKKKDGHSLTPATPRPSRPFRARVNSTLKDALMSRFPSLRLFLLRHHAATQSRRRGRAYFFRESHDEISGHARGR